MLENHMNRLVPVLMLLCLAAISHADSLEPFTDSPAGERVSGKGWLIADLEKGSGFGVLVFTDTGYRVLPVTLASGVDVGNQLGRKVVIRARILRDRSLEIIEVGLMEN